MAKSKKPAAQSAAKKTPTPKAPEKSKLAHAMGAPLIDTSQAAASAAKMLIAGLNKPGAVTSGAAPQESAMFKQLKAGLSKPAGTTMSNLLEKSQGPELTKSHPQAKQVGQNQTFNADVTRSGVPRRTPG